MKNISILGSTGSIGVQALEVVAASKGALRVVGLSAGKNIQLLAEQIKKFKPETVSVTEESDAQKLQKQVPGLKVLWGAEGLLQTATLASAEMVLVAVVGVAALKPTIEAIKQKKDIALASKEILVAAGEIVTVLVKQYGVKLLPVDSEHSAILQCGCGEQPAASIHKIILTASGGAFRGMPQAELKYKKLADALKHPNWQMGKKITIDSATLMNKGLEVIEAHWLFGLPYDKIEVLIHPQSIIHSMVEYVDGSVIAQLGLPDMRLPIQYAFYYPQRVAAGWPKLDLAELKNLTFQKPDQKIFKALELAYQAGKQGGTLPAVLNAANEAAVNLFMQDKISFLDIADLVEAVLQQHKKIENPMLEQIIAADEWARAQILQKIKNEVAHV